MTNRERYAVSPLWIVLVSGQRQRPSPGVSKRRSPLRAAIIGLLALTAGGCAVSTDRAAPADTASAASEAPDLERDQAAIRAMAGGYRVRFRFHETVVLAPGYERAEPHVSGGRELVKVIVDEPRYIVLQHLLVTSSGDVTKHWRQAWRYEAERRLEYTGDQTWQLRTIEDAKTEGAWTQCVYGVADTPRYCGTGAWRHEHGVSTWTSDRTRRPLPRREHTKRDDYSVMTAVHRHTITPNGWTHEQDNKKLRITDNGKREPLVREAGFNTYREAPDFDYGPAREYWTETADYWARVRAAWSERIDRHAGIRRTTAIDGMGIIEPLFVQARRVRAGDAVPSERIEAVLDDHTAAP